MKNSIVIIACILLLMFGSCKKEDEGKVKVRFTNKSAYEIRDIKIQDRNVGNLKAGEISKWIHFDHYTFDSGQSAENMEVIKNGNKITYHYSSFCGTEYKIVKEGNYDVDINIGLNKEGQFYLQP